jgi:acyl-CoA synthetase (AMP-forming)/AMP-acid ligase II
MVLQTVTYNTITSEFRYLVRTQHAQLTRLKMTLNSREHKVHASASLSFNHCDLSRGFAIAIVVRRGLNMRRPSAASSFTASTYAILILGIMSVFLLYTWVNEANAAPSDDNAKDLLIERLLSSNQQLRRSLDDAKAASHPSDVIVPLSSKPCICESDEKVRQTL